MNTFSMKPFVKWAGGKSQLLERLTSKIPDNFGRYHEPFVGGGAFLLSFMPKKATINDSNEKLINVFNQLKMHLEELISSLSDLDSEICTKERYSQIRDTYNAKKELDAENAAMFIWLNKHCFNGLYRVNSKGMFNVPWNKKKTGISFEEDNLRLIGQYLRKNDVTIACKDFETVCSRVRPNDFVYFDSPYLPVSETAYFTDYTADGFKAADHERLAQVFRKLSDKGVKVMLSNNDVPRVYELYDGFNIERFDVKRMINSNANKRTGKEVIVTNY